MALHGTDQDDNDLLEAARAAIRQRYRLDWHVVGAALRLKSGQIVTGVNMAANVGRIAVCAESIALGRAVTEHGSAEVERIVAVYHLPDGNTPVIAPCGMCREMLSDYAPAAQVLMPDGPCGCTLVPIQSLLPGKYRRPT